LDFEFLKFELLHQGNARFFPMLLNFEHINNASSPDLKKEKSEKDRLNFLASDASTIYDENVLKESNEQANILLNEKENVMSDGEGKNTSIEIVSEDIYSFGGRIVDQSNEVNQHMLCYSVGTTANVVFIRKKMCYIANVGDSMAVLYKAGKAVRLNLEHKISLSKERERIFNSGTNIINNRVGGRLNLTRAIGDHMFKSNSQLSNCQQAVIALPEIHKFTITDDMEFIVMGCDGIWDCVDVQDICDFISIKIKEKVPVPKILSEMFGLFLSKIPHAKVGSDNMTCIIIELKH